MKKINIAYWIFTGLFAALMLFSAIPDAMVNPDAVTFMAHLGYPKYFIPFIGIAKILGVIAILIPGFPRVKEWAYAGLMYDLIGATYSVASVGDPGYGWLFMFVFMGFGLASYIFYHKKLKAAKALHSTAVPAAVTV
jgi:uncharacterized membrane protein YphA (DoxX/SURF4 family)